MDRSEHFRAVVAADVAGLVEAEKHYGESWYKRNGAGAFFMLARKWDRIENCLTTRGNFNLLDAVREDQRKEGIIDDIRDLRRYLVLVEAKLAELGQLPGEVAKGAETVLTTGQVKELLNLVGEQRSEAFQFPDTKDDEEPQPKASSLHPEGP